MYNIAFTAKLYYILEVKNAMVKSVCCVTGHTIYILLVLGVFLFDCRRFRSKNTNPVLHDLCSVVHLYRLG